MNPELRKVLLSEDITAVINAYRAFAKLDAMRSTIRWFTYKFWTRISHHLSQFATVFIEWRAKGSNATSCVFMIISTEVQMSKSAYG